MFQSIAQDFHQDLLSFKPFPTITDRKAWEKLDSTLKKAFILDGEKYLDYTYPSLSATLFLKFTRTGNRTLYETAYFQRRNALNALVLAECLENKGRFLDDILNGIWLLCEESAWHLPAHNSYVRDTPNLPLPDVTRPIIELFACETGAQLAMIYYLLKDVLAPISPFIISRIEHELSHRIIAPYLNEHFWWMGNGDEPMCNWTIWCTQNILLTAFLTPQTNENRERIFQKATTSIDYFLKDYGEDGCCDEGAQYYHHAGLCLFNALEVLNAISQNAFSTLYQEEKIKNIAAYISNVHVSGPYYINFADCSPKAGLAGVRAFLFGKRTSNFDLMNLAATHYKMQAMPQLTEEINLFYRVQSIFTHSEITAYQEVPSLKQDLYYSSVGLFISRDSHYVLAVKTGDNADSHNHNDTGSITLYKNGKPFLIDVGVESYTQKTFSPNRYEIWTMQSDYHNLPTINGIMEQDGPSFKATDVYTSFSDKESLITMELSSAYPKNCEVESYRRQVILEKGKEVRLTDSFVFSKTSEVILNLMTYEKPTLIEASHEHFTGSNLLQIGDLGSIRLENAYTHIEIETIPVTDARLQTCWEHELYRICITLAEPEMTLCIR